MKNTETTKEEQRGKRRTARGIELTILALIVGSVTGVDHAFETLELVLPPFVLLIAALRGLDAHYKPTR